MSTGQIEPESVRAALSQVTGSTEFRASKRRADFLEYLVHKVLSDDTLTIKAYNIGIDVLGRGEDFDPQLDPVVRVEAGRLRRDLEHYYLTGGRDDEIVFAIPKGTYVPEIRRRVSSRSDLEKAHLEADVSSGNGPRVSQKNGLFLLGSGFAAGVVVAAVLLAPWSYLAERSSVGELDATRVVASEELKSPAITHATLYVAPFAPISPDEETKALAHGISLEIAAITAQFPEVAVYPVSDGFSHRFESDDQDEAPKPAEYLLSGSARIVGDNVQVLAYLRDGGDGRQIWSEKFELDYDPQAVFEVQDSIALSVSRKLAEPFGILRESVRNELRTRYDLSLEQYRCVLLGYEYRTSFTKDLHLRARECLEGATRSEPEYARAWSLLALLVIDEVRMFHNPKPNASERALTAARKAVELDPKDPMSFQALSISEFTAGSTAAGLAAARKAIELNPHNMEALWQLGFREWLSGNYEEGARISQRAIEGSPVVTDWFYWVPAAEQYRLGNYDRALEYAERMGTPDLIFVEAIRAMTYGQLGMLEQAQDSLDLCRRLDPDFDSRARDWFASFQMHDDAVKLFIEGLRKAGLAA